MTRSQPRACGGQTPWHSLLRVHLPFWITQWRHPQISQTASAQRLHQIV